MLALLLLLGGAAILVTRYWSADLQRAANVTGRQQYLAGVVSANASEMAGSERAAVLSAVLGEAGRSGEHRDRFAQAAGALTGALAALRQSAEDAQTRDQLAGLEQQAKLTMEAHQEQQQAMNAQQMDIALSVFAQKSQPRLEAIALQAEALVERSEQETGG